MFLWGHHGVGKSSIYSQVADELGIGYVDFRAAQIEATDLRGYPKENEGRTIYCPPIELPVESPENSPEKIIEIMKKLNTYHKEGIIVFDELNRAQDPVIQASFQLFVEGRIGTWIKPEGWSCMAAGNFGNSYNVNDFCQAFIGRFCHVTLSVDEEYLSEWASYILKTYDDNSITQKIIQFICGSVDNINVVSNQDLGFKIERSPRLWEQVVKIEREIEIQNRSKEKTKYSKEAQDLVLAGLIGDMAVTYRRAKFDIVPRDILNEGVARLKSIKVDRSILSGLVYGIVGMVESLGNKIKEEQISNVMDFTSWLCDKKDEADLGLVICHRLFVKQFGESTNVVMANEKVAKIVSADNPWLKELIKHKKVYELTRTLYEEGPK